MAGSHEIDMILLLAGGGGCLTDYLLPPSLMFD